MKGRKGINKIHVALRVGAQQFVDDICLQETTEKHLENNWPSNGAGQHWGPYPRRPWTLDSGFWTLYCSVEELMSLFYLVTGTDPRKMEFVLLICLQKHVIWEIWPKDDLPTFSLSSSPKELTKFIKFPFRKVNEKCMFFSPFLSFIVF